MPFDGIVTKNIVFELCQLSGARIEKIYQPEKDEIILNIRSMSFSHKLLLSANASFPRIHLTKASKENPMAPPMFCMLLRKHIGGGKILGVLFHDYERVITILIESIDELGDLSTKKLIVEIMGKHSNIILTNQQDKIIDSIKHIDQDISSKREIMPARAYMLPPTQDKINPEELCLNALFKGKDMADITGIPLRKFLLQYIRGFSPMLIDELIHRTMLLPDVTVQQMHHDDINKLDHSYQKMIYEIKRDQYAPCIIYHENTQKPLDYHSIKITSHANVKYFDSIHVVIDNFFVEKDLLERLKQKKQELSKVLANNTDRCKKKIAIHQETLRINSDREKFKRSGELILANIYQIPKDVDRVKVLDFYNEIPDTYVEITIDPTSPPQSSAQKYFKQYHKAKSATAYSEKQLQEVFDELHYLESVMALFDHVANIHEIDEIRLELSEQGYIKLKKTSGKKKQKLSAPLHYRSTDGFDIFAGKNNQQNDILTLKTASSNDIWLHTKDIHGSHVIIRKDQRNISEQAISEAALIAAYHSKARMSSSVPVDYTLVKHVKKPSGAKPGMVIYVQNKTIVVTPIESEVIKLKVL